MGAGNVKRVYAQWAYLPHVPFRALTYMALVSRDGDDPPRFYGGRDALALAIGRTLTDESTDKERNAAYEAVRYATSTLTKHGAIKAANKAHTGRRQEWLLNLLPQNQPGSVDPEPSGLTQDHPGSSSRTDPEPSWERPRVNLRETQTERAPKDVFKEEEGSSSSPRTRGSAEQRLIDAGATEDEMRLAIEKIKSEHRPKSLGAYVKAMADNGDLEPFLADLRKEHRPKPSKPQWCGTCDQTTRLIDEGDAMRRCPDCNPQVVGMVASDPQDAPQPSADPWATNRDAGAVLNDIGFPADAFKPVDLDTKRRERWGVA